MIESWYRAYYTNVFLHSSTYTFHFHTLHSHTYLSPSSNEQKIPILPPRCDATRGTYNATRVPVMLQDEPIRLEDEDTMAKRNHKAMLSLGNAKRVPLMPNPSPIHSI